ncbi:rhodanese-like domain-containing protein [Geopsychrobacter electrodiphilus]|uniref:rhodanese-like domain-containing protein n=1 Tax=Geopsychrobacter electrodiphilus TaxID=225196 RepID=UPI00035C343D|nr:rhodanese-like domain-containing protein [Geopsychrobacter electrodiphilus]
MELSTGFRQLVAEAESRVKRVQVTDLLEDAQRQNYMLVDLRDIRELWREGTIPGSIHVPRGMLEFWVDPESPYFHKAFIDPKPLILFCNKGWRSALAADVCQRMGITRVAHIEGGYEAWVAAGGAVEPKEKR